MTRGAGDDTLLGENQAGSRRDGRRPAVTSATKTASGNVTVPVGALVRVATEIPLLQIGDMTLKNVRPCMAEVARICVQATVPASSPSPPAAQNHHRREVADRPVVDDGLDWALLATFLTLPHAAAVPEILGLAGCSGSARCAGMPLSAIAGLGARHDAGRCTAWASRCSAHRCGFRHRPWTGGMRSAEWQRPRAKGPHEAGRLPCPARSVPRARRMQPVLAKIHRAALGSGHDAAAPATLARQERRY